MNWCAFSANPPLKELELTEHVTLNVRSGSRRISADRESRPVVVATRAVKRNVE